MEPLAVTSNSLDDPSAFRQKPSGGPLSPLSPICIKRITIACATIVALFILFLIILFVGASIEKGHVDDAPSTLYFYETATVCAVNSTGELQTYPTLKSAHNKSSSVAHCGDCGHCSNPVDIQIYDDTKDSLTETSTNCATRAFFGGSAAVFSCFHEQVGFTKDCNDCWVDNVMCDMSKCVFTCIQMLMFGGSNNDGDGDLNDCLKCDEKRCGPAFIECSGANRRRSGIVSMIGRTDDEVCKKVDEGWMDLVS
jgi:hypothetical protein